MNKSIFRNIILALFLSAINPSFGQEYFLKLEKIKRGTLRKTKAYHEGHWVKLKMLNGKKLKGEYFVVDENTISVDGQNVLLSEILKIRFDNRHLFGGIVLTTLGPPIFFGGLLATAIEEGLSDGNEAPNNNAEIATAIGLGAFVTGLVILSDKNKRTASKRWKISIVKNE